MGAGTALVVAGDSLDGFLRRLERFRIGPLEDQDTGDVLSGLRRVRKQLLDRSSGVVVKSV